MGRHAQYYDTIYAEKPYAEEAGFVSALLKKHAAGEVHQLLELACGTGGHAFELEKLGYQITATDYSKDLLAVAEEKTKTHQSRIDFRFQDMRSLDLAKRDFDAVYCLFDSIGYVQTNKALLQVLKGVHSHLRAGGLFVFEFWHAAAMLRKFEPRRERKWKIGGAELTRVSSTQLDVLNQLAKVTYEFEEINPDGTKYTLEESQVNRYFLVQEISLFLETSGFVPLEWAPAYQNNQAINEDTWHVLCVARRA